ncbi:MAG TPA: hypothetical protein VGD37_22340 [Kofleriaceae bacterium]|jgi:hypothetical protein
MPARKLTRKKSDQPTRTARRAVSAPRFTRVTKSLKLSVPPDCEASVILKLVGHDERRYYAWWLLVGRYDQETMTASYRFTGEDTVRCDIPTGMPLSAATLQPYLARFLKGEHNQEDDAPVIIKGKPK